MISAQACAPSWRKSYLTVLCIAFAVGGFVMGIVHRHDGEWSNGASAAIAWLIVLSYERRWFRQ